MNLSNKIIKSISGFAHRWGLSFFLSALLSIPMALLITATWFHFQERYYSLKTLFLTAPLVFLLIIWLVWLITGKFLNWIKTKPINLHRRDYVAITIALIPLVAAVYYGWSSYGGIKILYTVRSNFEVEITILDDSTSSGNICLLEIKDHNGEKTQIEDDSIYDLTLTGDWTAGNADCLYSSAGSTLGSLKFNYVGPTGAVLHFLFWENKAAGTLLIRSNGIQVAEMDLSPEQEGSTLLSTPMFLSRTDMFIWSAIGTTGWFAILVVLVMILSLLLRNVQLPPPISALAKLIENNLWVSLVPLVIIALILFWPPGSYTSPDAGYYLSLAKNLYHGNGYVNPDLSPNIYRGPVLPLLISLSYSVFGENFRSAVIIERIFWLSTILISYILGKRLYNHRIGFLSSLFLLTTIVINATFYYIWTDGPVTFLILALQLMFWETLKNQQGFKYYTLMGAIMGIAYLLKQTVLFIAPLPILLWVIFSQHRTYAVLKRIIIFYSVFAFFYFGWDVYVYFVGGSSGQITGTINTINTLISYISNFISRGATEQNISIQTEPTNIFSIPQLAIFTQFYKQHILSFFRIAIVFPIALVFITFQAIREKNKADIFLVIGLLLFFPLILLQVAINFGFRQNLYFYCIMMIIISRMIDQFFSKFSVKPVSDGLVLIVAFSLIFIQISGGSYKLPKPKPIKNMETLDYFNNYQQIANWTNEHINPNEIIMMPSRDSNYLHILTSGNRQFETISTCMGDISFSPAKKCTPPYISLWVYKGTSDPDNPRNFIAGISETALISTIREKGVKYIIVTPSIYSLYNYLKVHPNFEKVTILDNFAIFRVIHPVEPMSNFENVKWETCLGKQTAEYLNNLEETNPTGYKKLLHEQIEPWMGLTEKDLEAFMNWQGCQFEANFPGSYSSP